MPERISITNRAGEYDTISEDPAASTSSSSQNDNTNLAGSSSVVTSSSDTMNQSQRSGNDTVCIGNVNNDQRDGDTTTTTNNNDNNQSSATTTRRPSQAELEQRMSELRAILPDASDEELRQMLGENDQASRNTHQSVADANVARRTTQAEATSTSSSPGSNACNTRQSGTTTTTGGSRRSRRSWHPCQAAPSRPGVFSVGGPVQGGNFDIGETDPIELEIKRIEAVSQVQEALNEKLGYNLRESGEYEEMDRKYKEGERMLAATGLERREKKLLPLMHQWDPPPASRKSLMKKEPSLPTPSEPIDIPLTFGESGNSGICAGKFILLNDEEEHKREEVDESDWADVSVDSSPLGPYDQVVRCWKCKATLKAHIEVGLVACPRCRSVSPATDIVIIR